MNDAPGSTPRPRAGWLQPLVAVTLMSVLAWGWFAPTLATVYTPDSYGYLLLGDAPVRKGVYSTSAVRDLRGARVFPQPNRSFPPLWPLVVGVASLVAGAGVNSGAWANALVLAASLFALWHLGRRWGAAASWLFVAVGGLFVMYDAGYQAESAAARSIPLVVLVYLLLLDALIPWLASGPVSARHGVWTGVLIAAPTLTRFDQLGFGVLMLALLFGLAGAAKHVPAALGLFGVALRLDPDSHLAWTNTGIARALQHDATAARGDLVQAIPDLEAAAKLSAGAARESAGLSECLEQAGRSADARALGERARAAGGGADWERERLAFRAAVFTGE